MRDLLLIPGTFLAAVVVNLILSIFATLYVSSWVQSGASLIAMVAILAINAFLAGICTRRRPMLLGTLAGVFAAALYLYAMPALVDSKGNYSLLPLTFEKLIKSEALHIVLFSLRSVSPSSLIEETIIFSVLAIACGSSLAIYARRFIKQDMKDSLRRVMSVLAGIFVSSLIALFSVHLLPGLFNWVKLSNIDSIWLLIMPFATIAAIYTNTALRGSPYTYTVASGAGMFLIIGAYAIYLVVEFKVPHITFLSAILIPLSFSLTLAVAHYIHHMHRAKA